MTATNRFSYLRMLALGLLAVTLLCTGCGGSSAGVQSTSDILSPSPVADEDISSGIEFDGSAGADRDDSGSAVSN